MSWHSNLAFGTLFLTSSLIAPFPVDAADSQLAQDRSRVFATPPIDGFERASEARLVVVFSPQVEACSPEHIEIVDALSRLQASMRDVMVLTLVPDNVSHAQIRRSLFDKPPPGHVLQIAREAWNAENTFSPRPRVEVWSGSGQLLLLKSMAGISLSEQIVQEITWCRSFTHPVSPERVHETD